VLSVWKRGSDIQLYGLYHEVEWFDMLIRKQLEHTQGMPGNYRSDMDEARLFARLFNDAILKEIQRLRTADYLLKCRENPGRRAKKSRKIGASRKTAA
jgi:hypothetical protein